MCALKKKNVSICTRAAVLLKFSRVAAVETERAQALIEKLSSPNATPPFFFLQFCLLAPLTLPTCTHQPTYRLCNSKEKGCGAP